MLIFSKQIGVVEPDGSTENDHINFRLILDLLEGFFITMATDVNLSENDPQVVKPLVIPFDLMYHSPRLVKNPASRCRPSFQIFPFLSIDDEYYGEIARTDWSLFIIFSLSCQYFNSMHSPKDPGSI